MNGQFKVERKTEAGEKYYISCVSWILWVLEEVCFLKRFVSFEVCHIEILKMNIRSQFFIHQNEKNSGRESKCWVMCVSEKVISCLSKAGN